MKLRTLLELARISNLPTVWSNVLAGAVLAGGAKAVPVAVAGLAGSLFYSGGMFLNDAFDAEIDARERPERPIPSGRVARAIVLALGLGMLALALLVLGALVAASTAGAELVAAGVFVAAGVLVYDRWHKGFAWSPVVMGLCRAGLYVLGAFAVAAPLGHALVLALLSLLFYVVGLTHVARFENASVVGRAWLALSLFAPALVIVATTDFALLGAARLAALGLVLACQVAWTVRSLRIALRGGKGSIPRAVVALIAGISLVDAAFVASRGAAGTLALGVALAAFALTLFLQRWVRGT